MKRRRFLQVAALSATLSGIPMPEPRLSWHWRGTALGAETSIQLVHGDRRFAHKALEHVASEIERLEGIFSLYKPYSDIVRLNQQGRLSNPPADLVSLLSTAQSISKQTGGAFDVSVQPLWSLYASHAGRQPSEQAIQQARQLVDYRAIDIGVREIRLARRHMAVTLNGIAQGYITDRVTERLRELGFGDVLVNTGELRGSGYRANGHAWQVGIEGTDRRIALDDRAIATSSPRGTVFEPTGQLHHLLDPKTGRPSKTRTQTSVVAPNAVLADALSTAASILERQPRRAMFNLVNQKRHVTLIERALA